MAGCALVVVALVTMAFVAAGPDEPVTSDVVAGSGVPAPDLVETRAPTAAPTATPVPEVDAAGSVEPAAGSDEEIVDTDDGSAAAALDAVVPEDFVPGFVADDLTDTGAHTSATPEPVAPQPAAATPPAPRPTSTPAPNPPAADPEPTATVAPVVPTPQPTAPQPTPGSSGSGSGPGAAGWAALRDCESSGNYGIDTGNGYYGAYQFSQATWDWVAGMVRPDLVGVVPSEASPGDQDALAFALYDLRGAAPWPTCGAYLR